MLAIAIWDFLVTLLTFLGVVHVRNAAHILLIFIDLAARKQLPIMSKQCKRPLRCTNSSYSLCVELPLSSNKLSQSVSGLWGDLSREGGKGDSGYEQGGGSISSKAQIES